MKKSLIVFGVGQQSDIISFYLKKMGRKIDLYCVDSKYLKRSKFNKISVISTNELLKKYSPKKYNLHVAISYSRLNSLRQEKFNFFRKKGYYLESIVNNKSLYQTELRLGQNSVILDSFIQPKAKVGSNTFIWSGSVIGHHSNIGNHCWISSGVTFGGNCNIKDLSFFGMNSTVGHFVNIGKSCFVGSGTHITNSVKTNSVVISPDDKKIPFNARKFFEVKNFK